MALAIVVALAVGSAAQAGFGKQALVDFALFAQRDFGFEDVDFAAKSSGILPASFSSKVRLKLSRCRRSLECFPTA